MEIKYFRLIKTISEEGSIANSSEKLFLTQSALSHQLKDLEDRLGFKVFHRTRNKWKLTDEGAELYKLGNEILERIDNFYTNIQGIQHGAKGHIKVSTECYSFYHGLPRFIQKMGLLYPDIDVDLILEATHRPIQKLLSDEIDIALVSTKPGSDLLACYETFEDEIFAIMHKENRLNELEFMDTHAFKEAHLIIHSFPLETVSVYERFLKPHKTLPSKISAIPLTEVALEMVNANLGILCMPKWALNAFNISKELAFKKIGKNGLKRKHYLVVRKADNTKRYIQDFISNFMDEFG